MNVAETSNHRLLPATFWFVGCVVAGIAGFWLQQALCPPYSDGMGLLPFRPLFFCALVWVAVSLYTFAWVVFGRRSRIWHGAVFFLLGGGMGFCDGFYFAWLVGSVIGAVSGAGIGVLTFILRHLTVRGA